MSCFLVSLSETKSELETLSNKVEKAANELKNTDEEDSASPYNKKMEVDFRPRDSMLHRTLIRPL